jgi:DNA-binding CsgD family transcriptional regulator
MYLEYIRPNLPYDRELLLPLPGPPGHSRRIRFIRKRGRDFDDTDRALAALIRPHLVAHLHALDLANRGITPLTTRQRQLLALVADGFSNVQAARRLGISAHTVRTHLQQIYTRLGVTSRSEATALVRPPGDTLDLRPAGSNSGITRLPTAWWPRPAPARRRATRPDPGGRGGGARPSYTDVDTPEPSLPPEASGAERHTQPVTGGIA